VGETAARPGTHEIPPAHPDVAVAAGLLDEGAASPAIPPTASSTPPRRRTARLVTRDEAIRRFDARNTVW
jgi:hypothetical protein